jgi:hypothetical protein
MEPITGGEPSQNCEACSGKGFLICLGLVAVLLWYFEQRTTISII